jgi:hypothetical protein
MRNVLAPADVEQFTRDGYVRVSAAFPRELADECRAFLWGETGRDPEDQTTCTRPVIRLNGYGHPPFQRVATSERLHGAFDQLVGPGAWLPRQGIGTFPIRFPHPDDPGDAGWHVDASFAADDGSGWRLNVRSRGRALLMLFLFSDVGPDDAPTRIKSGSHRDVPRFLAPAGDAGRDMFELCAEMDAAGRLDAPDRPTVLATGEAGDVYLCHPFLIHAAQRHRGTVPKFMAQPPLLPKADLRLDRTDGTRSPVEQAVQEALTADD